jgi:hypothetical protein
MFPMRRAWAILAIAVTACGALALLLQKGSGDSEGPCDGTQAGTGINGVYCGQGMDNSYKNGVLSDLLVLFLQGKTVVDVGAGQGQYAEAMKESNIAIRAFDGQARIEGFTKGLVTRADLTEPLQLDPAPQWILSFEVLEHIPPHLEPGFLANIGKATEGVIISCAIAGQGGTAHINTQPNDVVRDKLAELGFVFDPRASAAVRWFLHHRRKDHFSTNLMVFFRAAPDDVRQDSNDTALLTRIVLMSWR